MLFLEVKNGEGEKVEYDIAEDKDEVKIMLA